MGEECPSTKEELLTNTPYDDAFCTLLRDVSDWIRPVMEEAFGENLDEYQEIRFLMDKHYVNRKGGVERKRITDGAFKLIRKSTEAERTVSEAKG